MRTYRRPKHHMQTITRQYVKFVVVVNHSEGLYISFYVLTASSHDPGRLSDLALFRKVWSVPLAWERVGGGKNRSAANIC
jgi:hypothetical protein